MRNAKILAVFGKLGKSGPRSLDLTGLDLPSHLLESLIEMGPMFARGRMDFGGMDSNRINMVNDLDFLGALRKIFSDSGNGGLIEVRGNMARFRTENSDKIQELIDTKKELDSAKAIVATLPALKKILAGDPAAYKEIHPEFINRILPADIIRDVRELLGGFVCDCERCQQKGETAKFQKQMKKTEEQRKALADKSDDELIGWIFEQVSKSPKLDLEISSMRSLVVALRECLDEICEKIESEEEGIMAENAIALEGIQEKLGKLSAAMPHLANLSVEQLKKLTHVEIPQKDLRQLVLEWAKNNPQSATAKA